MAAEAPAATPTDTAGGGGGRVRGGDGLSKSEGLVGERGEELGKGT